MRVKGRAIGDSGSGMRDEGWERWYMPLSFVLLDTWYLVYGRKWVWFSLDMMVDYHRQVLDDLGRWKRHAMWTKTGDSDTFLPSNTDIRRESSIKKHSTYNTFCTMYQCTLYHAVLCTVHFSILGVPCTPTYDAAFNCTLQHCQLPAQLLSIVQRNKVGSPYPM